MLVPEFFLHVIGYLNYYSGAISAVATVSIAWFTWTLRQASLDQGRLTRASIDLGNKEYIASHRPRLRVVRITAETFEPDKESNFVVEIINYGDSWADVISVGTNVFSRGQPYKTKPITFKTTRILPGQVVEFDGFGGPFSSRSILAITSGIVTLCYQGVFKYSDGNGTVRSLSFFRQYDAGLGQFKKLPEGDPEGDREYES